MQSGNPNVTEQESPVVNEANKASGPAPGTRQAKVSDYFHTALHKGKIADVVADLSSMDFKAEVLPLDEHTFALLKGDFVFWAVTLLAVIPLFLVTLSDTQSQLAGFCLFFAAIWGLVFKKFVVEETGGWKLPLAALFITGLIGTNLLLLFYKVFPYMEKAHSSNTLINLFGFVIKIGILEELCKIAPVIAYIVWKRSKARPLTIVLIGVFSGLGFSAFENLEYAQLQVNRSALLTVRLVLKDSLKVSKAQW